MCGIALGRKNLATKIAFSDWGKKIPGFYRLRISLKSTLCVVVWGNISQQKNMYCMRFFCHEDIIVRVLFLFL